MNLYSALSDISTSLVLNSLFAEFPFLRTPIIKQIIERIVSSIIETLITKTEIGVHMLNIQSQTEEQRNEFLKAVQFHAEILSHGSTEDIKKAKENIRANAINFIKFYNN